MRVAFLTTVLPAERRSGGEAASQAFIDAFHAAGHEVVAVGYGRRASGYEPRRHEVMPGVRRIETQAAGRSCAAWMTRALVRSEPYGVAKFASSAYARVAAAVLRDWRPEVVVIDHAQSGWILWAGVLTPYVYLAHNVERDLHGGVIATEAGVARGWAIRREARLIGDLEARLVGCARRVWAFGEDDTRRLAAFGRPGCARAFALPSPPVGPGHASGQGTDVALLGTWSWRPGARGLRWFLDEVLPRLPADWRVEVAGSGGRWPSGDPRVVHRGWVDDATAFLAGARTVAVPAIAGGGVKVSLLHSIATGVQVVTTPLGARGLAAPPPNLRVADGAAEFAAALRRAREQPPTPRMLHAARDWAARRQLEFTADVAEELRLLEPRSSSHDCAPAG